MIYVGDTLKHYHFLIFGLSRLLSAKSWLSVKPGHASDLPFYVIFVSQKIFLRKILMTSLHVITGLPPIKNPGYAYVV